MEWVREQFNVVSLRSLTEDRDSSVSKPRLVITFDDGYRDNYTNALPVLDRLGLVATFFVTTGTVGGELKTHSGPLPTMTRDQLIDLADRGHEVGSHGGTHRSLIDLPEGDIHREVSESRERLESWLGETVTSFSYPNGDVDERVLEATRRAGYERAVSTREALVSTPVQNPFLLPRRNVHCSYSLGAFRSKTTAAFDWYRTISENF